MKYVIVLTEGGIAMKKILMLALTLVCIFSFSACNKQTQGEKTEVCALLKEIKDDKIVVDVVEYITTEDKDRIAELGLKDTDLVNGYYINNPEIELKEYTLIEETIYNFIDWKNDFVDEGADRNVSTKNKDDFIKYINTYENSEPRMPFFFSLEDGKVVSIKEIPMM